MQPILPCVFAKASMSASSVGTNSWSGGSRNLMVTGYAAQAPHKALQSQPCCIGSILARAASRSSTVSEQIISLNAADSVRHRRTCALYGKDRYPAAPKVSSLLSVLRSICVGSYAQVFCTYQPSSMILPNSPAIGSRQQSG